MRFDNELMVEHPLERVWEALIDVQRVTPCVPGAEVVGEGAEGSYDVAMKVKVGPIGMRYRGTVTLADQDDAAHRARLDGQMREVRGGGSVTAQIGMSAEGDDSRTKISLQTDVEMTGKAASLGTAMLGDVAAGVLEAFSLNLESMLGAPAGGSSASAATTPLNGAVTAAEPQATAAPAATVDTTGMAMIVAKRFAKRSTVPAAIVVAVLAAFAIFRLGQKS